MAEKHLSVASYFYGYTGYVSFQETSAGEDEVHIGLYRFSVQLQYR